MGSEMCIRDSRTITPYHPQCNSQAETFNKTLGKAIRTNIANTNKDIWDWERYVHKIQLAHNTAVHTASKVTPFATMLGYTPRLPIGPMPTEIEKVDQAGRHNDIVRHNLREEQANRMAKETEPEVFLPNEEVWFKSTPPAGRNAKFQPRWEKAMILQATGNNTYKIRREVARRRRAR